MLTERGGNENDEGKGTYNEWLKQKAQGNGPFSEYDKLKKRVLGY